MHRVLAAVVGIAAILIHVGLVGGPWAETEFVDETGGGHGVVDVDLSGDVESHGLFDTGTDLDDNSIASDTSLGTALRESTGGTLPQLTRIMAVLVMVIAGVGAFLDLTPRTWTLMSAASLGVLLATVILRDRTVAALSQASAGMTDEVTFRTGGTTWSGLAIGAAAVATLAAVLAAAPRPAQTDLIADPAGTLTTEGAQGRRRWPARGRSAQPLH